MAKTFHVRKKIAKHGKHAVIVVPKLLQMELVPGTIAVAAFCRANRKRDYSELAEVDPEFIPFFRSSKANYAEEQKSVELWKSTLRERTPQLYEKIRTYKKFSRDS